MITSAIERGVPMFNHGNPSATAAIYAETVEMILESPELLKKERARLEQGLAQSKGMTNSQAQAWSLRYALDDVMRSLQHTRQLSTSTM